MWTEGLGNFLVYPPVELTNFCDLLASHEEDPSTIGYTLKGKDLFQSGLPCRREAKMKLTIASHMLKIE